MSSDNQQVSGSAPFGPFGPAYDYMIDAAQRCVLFMDVMRQRGNQYHEHMAEAVPHVLDYAAELVIDGRTLKRPVNYLLVRIVPPKGVEIDMKRAVPSWWWITRSASSGIPCAAQARAIDCVSISTAEAPDSAAILSRSSQESINAGTVNMLTA